MFDQWNVATENEGCLIIVQNFQYYNRVYAQGLTSDSCHRLYVSEKEGGRGLTRIVGCLDASVQRIKKCIKKRK